ncbi:hypothetical protein SMMN14_06066 [Sphaerulina musiva]
MHNTNILLAFAATAICAVRGQGLGLDNNDVPPECRSLCQPVIDVEASCDNQFDDDAQQYRNCVCQNQSASQALPACDQCAAQYPNFFIDRNDNDGPDIDDNEISAWARICGLPAIQPNGTGPMSSGVRPPASFTTSMMTTTQIYDCDDPDDIINPTGTGRGDRDDPRCTRTTVVPVVGVVAPMTTGPSGPAPTVVSVSYTTSTGTNAAGSPAVFTSAVSTYTGTGGAALPTAAAGYFGAGAAALLAAFAL